MDAKSSSTQYNSLVQPAERLAEPTTHGIAVQALDSLALETGQSLIEVAAGTGGLAVAAATRGYRVLATDIAPAMVQRTAGRLTSFPGCQARVMNLNALDSPDGSFDAAISSFGVLVFETWPQGLKELVRVTRPGGRIAATAWTENRDASPALLLKRVFETHFPERHLWPSDFFPHWSTDSLWAALHQAGCDSIDVRVGRAHWSPVSPAGEPTKPEEALDDCDPLFRNFPGYRDLTDAERERLREPLASALSAYADPAGVIHMPVEAYIAVGHRSTRG